MQDQMIKLSCKYRYMVILKLDAMVCSMKNFMDVDFMGMILRLDVIVSGIKTIDC